MTTTSTNGELRSALVKVYLQSGQIDKGEVHFAIVAPWRHPRAVPEPTKAPNAALPT
jgi:hypothetical protein